MWENLGRLSKKRKCMRISLPRIIKQRPAIIIGITAFLALLSFVVVPAPGVQAACYENDIMYCGFSTNQTFYDKIVANNDGHGHTDLQTIYNHFGLKTTDDYTRFRDTARAGVAYRDGRVVVDNQVVATGVNSLGRHNEGVSSPINIGGKTYYYGTPANRWSAGRESFTVRVLFDKTGTAQFIVINACGNPLWGTNVVSNATCNTLNKADVPGKPNTYNFTANATPTGLAQITKYVYDFGDGTPSVETTSPTQIVPHTYTKVGTFTATLTVYASAPGGTTITATAATCKQTILVSPPAAPKVTITKVVNGTKAITTDTGKNFVYQLKVTNTGNVTLANVVVSDDAPRGIQFISTDKGSVTGNKLNYTIPSLAIGQNIVINITAKATIYTPTPIVNKACVDTPTVPGSPDACDTANVTVNPPLCSKLNGPNPSGLTYTFVATGSYGEGVTLVSGDFDFGDGKTANGVLAAGSTVTTTHAYASAATYSVVATLRFLSDGQTYTAPGCRASVKPETPPTPECKAGIPVGDIRCNPCEYDASIPKDDPRCVAPPVTTTLPNTGAGNVVALASAALVGGFLWYRHLLFRRHKRAYLAADMGTSPLPLAEPLESPSPLAATPLAPQSHRKFGLRRRRQF
jgi:uncharacterized repeat protein (TIGR01451 family)